MKKGSQGRKREKDFFKKKRDGKQASNQSGKGAGLWQRVVDVVFWCQQSPQLFFFFRTVRFRKRRPSALLQRLQVVDSMNKIA